MINGYSRQITYSWRFDVRSLNPMKFTTALLVGNAATTVSASATNQSRHYKFGAIYFGDWHVDPVMSALHGPNWTEFNVVTHATPRYEGHLQPNIPLDNITGFGPSSPENVPANMEVKISTAKKAGVDFFLFDWFVHSITVV